MSNSNVCPLIWMFTSKTSLSKLENIQLNVLLDVYMMIIIRAILICYITLTYPELRLWSCDISQLKFFKCVKEISPAYLNAMITRKECAHALRDSAIWVRPNVNLTQYGLKSFKSYGARIWNNLPTSYKANISLYEFKTVVISWDGPKCKCCVWDLYT